MDQNKIAEIEDFVTNVEDVSEQIKKIISGEYNEKEYQEIERRLNKEKYRKEEEEKRKARLEREREEKKEEEKKGRPGNGEKNNFCDYCRFCKVEYVIETKYCFRCKKETETQQERENFLKQEVEKLKKKKLKKEEAKKRWELWQKTQKIYKNKNITDYEKWRNFTDSFDSDEEYLKNNPVIPKESPEFQAMEKDIIERKNKRKADHQVSENLKNKGNTFFQNKNYYNAIQEYTKGIEASRNNKALWLNRALAYIKFGKFEDAVKDCTEMIEYMEILEDGFVKSKNFAIKAFLRRSQAYFELDLIDKAFEDVQKAKEIMGQGDKEIEEHLLKIKNKLLLQNLVKNKQFEEDSLIFRDFLDSSTFFDFSGIYSKMQEDNKNKALLIFNIKVGEKIARDLTEDNLRIFYSNENILKMNSILFLKKMIEEEENFFDYFKKTNCFYNLLKLLTNLSKNIEKKDLSDLFAFEQILDLMIEIAYYKSGRNSLLEKFTILFNVFENLIQIENINKKKYLNIFISILKLFSNMAYNETEHINSISFKKQLYEDFKIQIFNLCFSKNNLNFDFQLFLTSSVFLLLTNLTNNKSVSASFFVDINIKKDYFFEELTKLNKKCLDDSDVKKACDFLQKQFDLFNNLFVLNDPIKYQSLFDPAFVKTITTFFIRNYKRIDDLFYQKIISFMYKIRLEKLDSNLIFSIILKNFLENTLLNNQHNNTFKILAKELEFYDKEKFKKNWSQLKNINNHLKSFFYSNYKKKEEIYSLNNTIIFLSKISDIDLQIMNEWEFLLQPLTYIVKESVGALRKTAAILLAKLCRVPSLERKARELHAQEILINLSQFIIDK